MLLTLSLSLRSSYKNNLSYLNNILQSSYFFRHDYFNCVEQSVGIINSLELNSQGVKTTRHYDVLGGKKLLFIVG